VSVWVLVGGPSVLPLLALVGVRPVLMVTRVVRMAFTRLMPSVLDVSFSSVLVLSDRREHVIVVSVRASISVEHISSAPLAVTFSASTIASTAVVLRRPVLSLLHALDPITERLVLVDEVVDSSQVLLDYHLLANVALLSLPHGRAPALIS